MIVSSTTAPESEAEDTEVRRPVRTAPARPKLSSSLESENEDNEGTFSKHRKTPYLTHSLPSEAEDSEGLVLSDTESVTPTVEQLLAEVSKCNN